MTKDGWRWQACLNTAILNEQGKVDSIVAGRIFGYVHWKIGWRWGLGHANYLIIYKKSSKNNHSKDFFLKYYSAYHIVFGAKKSGLRRF
jgi:hypothetical protein